MSEDRHDLPRTSLPSFSAWIGLLLLALVGLLPLLCESRPVVEVAPPASPLLAWGSKGLVLLILGLIVAWRGSADRLTEPHPLSLTLLLVGLAVLLTGCHWLLVDQVYPHWQRQLYLDILNHHGDAEQVLRAPHQFRPLPYGFTRSLELFTGDWWFSCLAYRCFFTYWFAWAWYRFARLFLAVRPALLALLPLPLLYPLSILYYQGQLTDPVSHALFVLALLYIVQERWLVLALTLALGIMAKETAVILVPAYWASAYRQGIPAFLRTVFLGLVCVAAFLAVRLPLGWWPGLGSLNGTEGLMVGTNLGFAHLYRGAPGDWTVWHNYLHPLLFVGVFLPPILYHWRRLDRRLRPLVLTLTPLLLLSNLCFGWMYESRNYLPLVPLLITAVLQTRNHETHEAHEK